MDPFSLLAVDCNLDPLSLNQPELFFNKLQKMHNSVFYVCDRKTKLLDLPQLEKHHHMVRMTTLTLHALSYQETRYSLRSVTNLALLSVIAAEKAAFRTNRKIFIE